MCETDRNRMMETASFIMLSPNITENTLSCFSPIRVRAATVSEAHMVALKSKTLRGDSCRVWRESPLRRENWIMRSKSIKAYWLN